VNTPVSTPVNTLMSTPVNTPIVGWKMERKLYCQLKCKDGTRCGYTAYNKWALTRHMHARHERELQQFAQQRRRDKIWNRRWPFLELLMRGGLFMGPMLRAHHIANQAALDKFAKIEPLRRDYAFLLQQIFMDNEHLLRLIVYFL